MIAPPCCILPFLVGILSYLSVSWGMPEPWVFIFCWGSVSESWHVIIDDWLSLLRLFPKSWLKAFVIVTSSGNGSLGADFISKFFFYVFDKLPFPVALLDLLFCLEVCFSTLAALIELWSGFGRGVRRGASLSTRFSSFLFVRTEAAVLVCVYVRLEGLSVMLVEIWLRTCGCTIEAFSPRTEDPLLLVLHPSLLVLEDATAYYWAELRSKTWPVLDYFIFILKVISR